MTQTLTTLPTGALVFSHTTTSWTIPYKQLREMKYFMGQYEFLPLGGNGLLLHFSPSHGWPWRIMVKENTSVGRILAGHPVVHFM